MKTTTRSESLPMEDSFCGKNEEYAIQQMLAKVIEGTGATGALLIVMTPPPLTRPDSSLGAIAFAHLPRKDFLMLPEALRGIADNLEQLVKMEESSKGN